MTPETLVADFSPFTDIGESAPKVTEHNGKFIVRLTRDCSALKIEIDPKSETLKIQVGRGAGKPFLSIGHLLASEQFANLRRWADIQREALSESIKQKMLPINGRTHNGSLITTTEEVSQLLSSTTRNINSSEILLIDGPAGIGKTNLIAKLALERAKVYKQTPTALILHIKSRGRVLSNLDDLMAFSLQSIRSNVTYDQIPVLVRHGLIIAAIDGFDELGDPNGYDTAWAQLSDLISSVRGKGTLILAGRDTFISRARLLKDVNSLRKDIDAVNCLTIDAPSSEQARDWLLGHGWSADSLNNPAISVLFGDDSFARRPVFLKLIADPKKLKINKKTKEGFLTSFLLRSIIFREASLFGKKVESVFSTERIESILADFMLETAREMADSQADSLDGATLSWVVETALGDGVDTDIVGIFKNRAAVFALLVNDERPGYKTFVHSQIHNYYLSRVAIEAIAKGEIPKFIRRNILGADFLSTFVDTASEYYVESSETFSKFISRAQNLAQIYPHFDRGSRNIGALLLASLQNINVVDDAYFAGFQVDEAIIKGTAGPAKLSEVVISQLDCRQADLRSMAFENSSIITLIADEASRFSASFPVPNKLVDGTGAQITDAEQIETWLGSRGRVENTSSLGVVPRKLQDHRVYELLSRACRMRRYWLREGDNDVHAEKILKDPNWAMLSKALRNNDFLREENREASGGSAPFIHIKHKERLLAESPADKQVVKFFIDLEHLI